MTQLTVVGGDDIAQALERVLRENVPVVQQLLGLEDLGEIRTWQQVPTSDALTSARLPAAALVAPRMSTDAQRGAATFDGTWQVSVAVFVREKDHASTQAATQQWAKVIRVAALVSRSLLKDPPIQLRWVGEEYDLEPSKGAARTLGGCEVFFDAIVENVMDLNNIRNAITAVSVVTETHSTVTLSN